MEEKKQREILPEHHTGRIIDTESSKELDTTEDAKAFYQQVKQRLVSVNQWHEYAGTLSAAFQVVDREGREVERTVREGDYFKINIPGPAPDAGEGYDWVRVEAVNELQDNDAESIIVRVRPARSPEHPEEGVAHFYSPESTSSFVASREGRKVIAGVYDRNTKPNDASPDTDRLRNTVVGTGAVTLFSKIQWKALVEGLLEIEEQD